MAYPRPSTGTWLQEGVYGMARRLFTQTHRRIVRALAVVVLVALAVTSGSAAGLLGGATAWAATGDNLVLQWNQAALDAITDPGVPAIRRTPPVAARSLAIRSEEPRLNSSHTVISYAVF